MGEVISWPELRAWLEWLPPSGDSALYRSRHPHDWWYDWPVQMAAYQLLALQGANWQRGGGQGARPKLLEPVIPEPQPTQRSNVIPIDEIKDRLAAARRAIAAARTRQDSAPTQAPNTDTGNR